MFLAFPIVRAVHMKMPSRLQAKSWKPPK